MKLKHLLIAAFLCLSVVPFFLSFQYFTQYNSSQYRLQVEEKLAAVSQIAKKRVLDVLGRVHDNTALIASRTQMRASLDSWNKTPELKHKEKITKILRDAKGNMSRIQEIIVYDPDGKRVASTNNDLKQSTFIEVPKDEHSIRLVNKDDVVVASMSRLEYEGKVVGYICIEFTAAFLFDLIKDRTGLGETGEWLIAVRAENGDALSAVPLKYVSDAAFKLRVSKDNLATPVTQALLGNEQIMRNAPDYDGEPVLASTRYIPELDWGLVVKINEAEINAKVDEASGFLIWLGVFVAILSILAGIVMAYYIAKPIERLKQQTSDLAKGQFNIDPITKGWREVTELSTAFQEMAGSLQNFKDNLNQLVSDRTEDLNEANQDLEEKNRELDVVASKAQSANRVKSEFLASMSHEIRTPMNGIIGATGLILDTALSSKQQNFAETIMKSANALLNLINDILDFSKIEAGKLDLELISFDMQELIEDVAELVASKCKDNDIELLVSFSPDLDRYVIGDPGRVRQILLNLISNSIKFTEGGHVFIRARSTKSKNGSVNFDFEIRDTGIGIAPDKQALIFEKFSQADASTTRQFGGTGLGLSICQDLVKLMGGSIGVESKLGEGACFSFNIALKQADKPTELSDDLNAQSAETLNGLRLLVVDDSEISLEIVAEQLDGLGMDIQSVASGPAALEALKKAESINKPFDLLLSDYCMPDMDGHMLAEEIQKDKEIKTPQMTLMLSSPERGDGKRVLDLGFRGYLTKPIFPGIIKATLSKVWKTRDEMQETALITRHSFRENQHKSEKRLNFKGVQILLVEDNPINQMIATKMLERYECSVTPAGNGKEAVEQFKQRRFDLILMDCYMPEMDGFLATKEIRNIQEKMKYKHTPIVAFTANAMAKDRKQCLDAGMDDFISKPVQVKELEKVLGTWLVKEDAEDDVELIDYSELEDLENKIGDKLIPIVECFIQFAEQTSPKLQQAFDADDENAVKFAAHSFKPICHELGAVSLGRLAHQMELLADKGELDNARLMLPEFLLTSEKVSELMRNYIEEHYNRPKNKIA
ncbi:response regulator [Kiloniella antarctica]|uniref:histidine kinase n=1 Tax=Kiloniella antarctica TaxID=1550907 RepID=A0ABW5BKS9_9PROT